MSSLPEEVPQSSEAAKTPQGGETHNFRDAIIAVKTGKATIEEAASTYKSSLCKLKDSLEILKDYETKNGVLVQNENRHQLQRWASKYAGVKSETAGKIIHTMGSSRNSVFYPYTSNVFQGSKRCLQSATKNRRQNNEDRFGHSWGKKCGKMQEIR
mmetsp:Transcript_30584/g.37221  ORF Transcript_30584/g.37221 Transcript_30584/m.37221 type:complete len:156 (+) Transcript_30584:42-509(+)